MRVGRLGSVGLMAELLRSYNHAVRILICTRTSNNILFGCMHGVISHSADHQGN